MKIVVICLAFCTCVKSRYVLTDDEKIVNKLLVAVANDISHRLPLRACSDRARMLNEISLLGLGFNHYGDIDVALTRQLLMECIDVFLVAVNHNEAVQPYLANHPFEPKNIDIAIYMLKEDGSLSSRGELAYAHASEGKFVYAFCDNENDMIKSIRYEETYEEAVEVLKGAPSNLRRRVPE
jgi:hypothetical protein